MTCTETEWIPASERLPESWAIIVIYGCVQKVAARFNGHGWEWFDEEADIAPEEVVTHWMPFPGAPMTERESNAAKLLGRKGGRSKSDAKVQASRDNGKRGGRPKPAPTSKA